MEDSIDSQVGRLWRRRRRAPISGVSVFSCFYAVWFDLSATWFE
jgi:hypothetical protein